MLLIYPPTSSFHCAPLSAARYLSRYSPLTYGSESPLGSVVVIIKFKVAKCCRESKIEIVSKAITARRRSKLTHRYQISSLLDCWIKGEKEKEKVENWKTQFQFIQSEWRSGIQYQNPDSAQTVFKWKGRQSSLSTFSLLDVQLMASSIRPRLSVWSQPHKFGTLSSHRLCTFISHAVCSLQQRSRRKCGIKILFEKFHIRRACAETRKWMQQVVGINLPLHFKPWWSSP